MSGSLDQTPSTGGSYPQCTTCGRKLREWSRFCTFCGARMEQIPTGDLRLPQVSQGSGGLPAAEVLASPSGKLPSEPLPQTSEVFIVPGYQTNGLAQTEPVPPPTPPSSERITAPIPQLMISDQPGRLRQVVAVICVCLVVGLTLTGIFFSRSTPDSGSPSVQPSIMNSEFEHVPSPEELAATQKGATSPVKPSDSAGQPEVQSGSGTQQPATATSSEGVIGSDPGSPGTGGNSPSGSDQQSSSESAPGTVSTSIPSSSGGQSSIPGGINGSHPESASPKTSTSRGTTIPAGSSSRSTPTATPGNESSSPSKRSKRSESDANSVIIATNRRQDEETEPPSTMKRRRSRDEGPADPDDEYSSNSSPGSRPSRDWPRDRRRDADSRQDVMSYPRNGIAVWTGAAGRSQRVTVYGFPGIPISVNRPAVRGGHARMITPPSPSNGWKYAVVEFERGEGTCEVSIPWQRL